MKKFLFFLIPFLLFCGNLQAADGFEAVKCGSDIPKALMGKRMKNERVVVLEARHKDIGLKDLGASEISDHMDTISWLICGSEYMLIEADSVVRDVLPFPPHSKSSPAFDGLCEMKGIKMPEEVVGVLEDQPGKDFLPVKQAWKVDEKNAKFVKLPTEGLLCARSGIFSLDGGK